MTKSRKIRWAGHVACVRDDKYVKMCAGKPEGNRLIKRPRRRWEDNIKMALRERG
jgi:hypothetical protein